MRKPFADKGTWIGIPLLLIWVTGTVYAFWWFQAKDLQSFDTAAGDRPMVFEGNQLAQQLEQLVDSAQTEEILLVHFWNPECSCNRFNNPHVQQIIEKYRNNGVKFVTVARSISGQTEQEVLARARDLFHVPAILDSQLDLSSDNTPIAAPAAAVITREGKLAYYGPYSDSAFCGTNGVSFVEKALDSTLGGKTGQETMKTLAFGCFCDWQAT